MNCGTALVLAGGYNVLEVCLLSLISYRLHYKPLNYVETLEDVGEQLFVVVVVVL